MYNVNIRRNAQKSIRYPSAKRRKTMVEEKAPLETEKDDLDFINSLLNPEPETETETELTEAEKAEAEALKKKNAEEAQKRREREAKEKAEKETRELEEKAKAEAEAKAKAEQEAKQKTEEETRAKSESEKQRENQVTELAKQIADFRIKNPEIDIEKLQKDTNFTEYLSGKLLGKKTFTELFESYNAFVNRIGGVSPKEQYSKNADKPSSKSANKGTTLPEDVYTEEEMERIARKMPFMSRQELEKINEKLNRSMAYYNKK